MDRQKFSDMERRAHHNALERNRRDKMKTSFNVLRNAISTSQGQKISREQILLQAASFIRKNIVKHDHVAKEIHELAQKIKKFKKEIEKFERDGERKLARKETPSESQSESEFDNYTSSEDPEWTVNIDYQI